MYGFNSFDIVLLVIISSKLVLRNKGSEVLQSLFKKTNAVYLAIIDSHGSDKTLQKKVKYWKINQWLIKHFSNLDWRIQQLHK